MLFKFISGIKSPSLLFEIKENLNEYSERY